MITRLLGSFAAVTGIAGGLYAQTPTLPILPADGVPTVLADKATSLLATPPAPVFPSSTASRLGAVTPSPSIPKIDPIPTVPPPGDTVSAARLLAPVPVSAFPMGPTRTLSNLPRSYLATEGYRTAPVQAERPAARLGDKAIAAAGYQAPAEKPAAKLGNAAAPGTPTIANATTCPQYVDQCCNPCALCCDPCGPPGRWWVAAEWIYWKTTGQYVPPLVTTSVPGTPRPVAGTLGNPNTTVLFGGQNYNNDFRSGFRITGGFWFDPCNTCGIEGDFFYLGPSRTNAVYDCDGNGNPPLFRPFINALTGQQDSELVCFPDVVRGSVAVDTQSDLVGGGFNFIKNICCTPCSRFDLLVGYRALKLTDQVTITENLTVLSAPSAGTQFLIQDSFRTENYFHGGVIGFAAEKRFSHYYLGLRASVALGVNHQVTDIAGTTTIISPNGTAQTYTGGLLAQPSNIGHYETNMFCVVPEIGIKAGVQLTPHARMYVGYNYLAMSNVMRAGDQIDLRVNTNQIPPSTGLGGGPAVPAYPGNQSTFSAHGVSVGLEIRF